MKTIYNTPDMEIIVFEYSYEVVTTSGETNELPPMPIDGSF